MSFLLLLLLALLGHAVLWTAFVNRLHATAIPHRVVNPLSYAALVAVIIIPVALLTRIWQILVFAEEPIPVVLLTWLWPPPIFTELPAGWLVYLTICWTMAAVDVVGWAWRRILAQRDRGKKSQLISRRSVQTLGDKRHQHPLLALPGNQSLRVDVVERELCLQRLHPGLDGFSIVHLSDLHFSGRIGKSYFEEMVRLSNELEPDMVAITGDLVDKNRCIDWLPDTLGKLRSRCASCSRTAPTSSIGRWPPISI